MYTHFAAGLGYMVQQPAWLRLVCLNAQRQNLDLTVKYCTLWVLSSIKPELNMLNAAAIVFTRFCYLEYPHYQKIHINEIV